MPQLPPDSHCAMASQFTLYARWTGGGASTGGASGAGGASKPTGAGAGAASGAGAPGAGGGASKPTGAGAGGGASGAGGGGTFGSKPTGAGAGASGAGGGGTSGTDPAGAAFGATFGSRPIVSALAVAVGNVTSAPVIAASMSVLRTFFNYVPFAVRARQSNPQLWVDVPCSTGPDRIGIEEVLWGVPSRSGTTAGGVRPDGLGARLRGGCRRRSPAHTRVRGLIFVYCALPVLGYRRTVRDGSAFVIFTNDISRFDNEPITARSINCLCRSTRCVRQTSLHRDL
jgi:hypothetical protein